MEPDTDEEDIEDVRRNEETEQQRRTVFEYNVRGVDDK